MLLLPTFLIFLSLSVAAIPLGQSANGQTLHIRQIPSLAPAGLPIKGLPAGNLLEVLPLKGILRRFIMGADYASNSGPFLGKSSHKRQESPVSGALGSATLRANGLTEDIPPKLSSSSTPT